MIIQTTDLCKAYGRNDALRGLNLSVAEGTALALIGANLRRSAKLDQSRSAKVDQTGYGITRMVGEC